MIKIDQNVAFENLSKIYDHEKNEAIKIGCLFGMAMSLYLMKEHELAFKLLTKVYESSNRFLTLIEVNIKI